MHTDNTKQKTNSSAPVELTESAVQKIQNMAAKENKEGYCLRIGVIPGGCAGLSYDLRFQKEPYENDISYEIQGLKIVLHPESISFLHGTKIDYIDTLKESGFQYKNPNAQSSCGCGTSFS